MPQPSYSRLLTAPSSPTAPGEFGMSGSAAPYTPQFHDGLKVVDLGAATSGSSTPTTVALTYASQGDTNGLVYYLGTKGKTTGFSNPALGTDLVESQSGEYSSLYNVANLTDRDGTTLANTLDVANSWWAWAIGLSTATIQVDAYTLRYRGDSLANSPISWKLQGSNDGTTWTDLDTRTNITPPTLGYITCTLASRSAGYNQLRLMQTSLNYSNTNYFILADVEFYGLYSSGVASSGSSADALQIETNVGTIPRRAGRFTITNAAILATSQILMTQAGGPYTGKGTRGDEAEMDILHFAATPAVGSAVVYWNSPTYVKGNFKMNYLVA